MSDLSAKLSLLKINRTEQTEAPPTHAGRWSAVALCAFALSVAAIGVNAFWHEARALAVSNAATVVPVDSSAPFIREVDTPHGTAAPAALIASGFVVARRRATVAAQVTGRLMDIRVEEGQQVNQGDVLALLDASIADSELTTAQARANSAASTSDVAAADLKEGRDVLERTKKLASTGFMSPVSLTHDEARVASLEAQLMRAKFEAVAARADATRLGAQRRQYEIRAPFAGVVVDKNAQPGEIVSPISGAGGFTRSGICTIVDMNSLEIQVEVNEAFIGRVREGQSVDALLDAYPKLPIAARVLAIVPTANRDKGSVRVRIALLHPDARILPDMAIKVTIHAS